MSKHPADQPRFSSPPCFAQDFESDPAVDRPEPTDLAAWRRDERRRLLAERVARPTRTRRQDAMAVAEQLDRILPAGPGTIVSLYWPFRGELNLRRWMRRASERGLRIALPVVESKSKPLVFREWTPGAPMELGIWKIPIPKGGEIVVPQVVIAPVVGFDSSCYRLGYGGGYYDRTLAALAKASTPPFAVGVGQSFAHMPTTHPQPHDVAMDLVVTELGHYVRPDIESRG